MYIQLSSTTLWLLALEMLRRADYLLLFFGIGFLGVAVVGGICVATLL